MYSPGAYIPIDRRIAIAENAVLPERQVGAVLTADISGFTPLTDALVQELGPQRGVEELTAQINAVYTALIAEVHRYRGAVIGFSGDAITCWFGSWPLPEDNPSLLASACALGMQETMKLFANIRTPGGKAQSLHIRIAITSGPVRRFLVGDPAIKCFDVLAGATLDRMSIAATLPGKGEIIVGPEVLASGGHLLETGETRTAQGLDFTLVKGLSIPVQTLSWQETTRSYLTLAQPDLWIPAQVENMLKSSQESYLGEFRPVTALFVKFEGLDYDNDAQAHQKLDVFIRKTQAILSRYGGDMIQITTGDKGSYLYAAFGAPIAHQDNSRRAVLAAFDLKEIVSRLEFSASQSVHIQMGMSAGTMRVGLYGSPTRQTYGVLGSEVNIAARLMAKAPDGQLLVTQRIVDELGDQFLFHALGSVSVAETLGRVPVFLVREELPPEPGGRPAHPPLLVRFPLLGRKAEQALLANRLEALQKVRSGGIILVEGEAGIGKTRFLEEVADLSTSLGLQTLFGSASSIDKTTPFYAWREVFHDLFGLPAEASAEEQQAHILRMLRYDPALPPLAPLVNGILPVDFPETRVTLRMAGHVRQEALIQFLVRLIATISFGASKVIVLDDVQWLDSASWSLVVRLYHDTPSVLLVLAHLPMLPPLPPDFSHLIHAPDVQRLYLTPLNQEDTLKLVHASLGVARIPEAAATYILSKTEGHPFYALEMAYALRDSGWATGLAGPDARNGSPKTFEGPSKIPDTIEGVIASRIDSLTPEEQLTLKVASVIGRRVSLRLLRDIHPSKIPLPQLLAELDVLKKLDILPQEASDLDTLYVFRHMVTLEAAYNRLLFSQRRKLHRAVAEWYEAHIFEDLASSSGVLAYHWGKAEEPQKQLYYLEKASRQALAEGANPEAARLLAEILESDAARAVAPAQRAMWQSSLAQAHLGLGDLTEARRQLHAVLREIGYSLPSRGLSLAWHTLKQLLRQALHLAGVVPGAQSGPKGEPRRAAARSMLLLAEIDFLSLPDYAFVRAALTGLNHAERGLDPLEKARGCTLTSLAAEAFGLDGLGNLYRKKARALLKASSGTPAAVSGFLLEARDHLHNGAWAQAEKRLTQAIQLSDQLGDQRLWIEGLSLLSTFNTLQGWFSVAEEGARMILEAARRSRNRQHEAWAHTGLATIHLHTGDLEKARAAALLALNLATESGDETGALQATGVLASALVALGRRERARQFLTRQKAPSAPRPDLRLLDWYTGQAEGHLAIVEAARHAGFARRTSAQWAARRALDGLHALSRRMPVGKPRAWLYRGQFEWLLEHPGRAVKAWQQALAWAMRLHMPYELGKAHLLLGRHLPASEAARADHLSQAAALFAGLGAAHDLQLTREAGNGKFTP